MDTEAMAARKKVLRTTVRARRTRIYGGSEGAQRRAQESHQLLAHAAPLIERVRAALESGAGADRSGDPSSTLLVAAYHPTPTEADVMPLARRLADLGAQLIFPVAAGHELDWVSWDGTSPFVDSPGRGFGKEPTGQHHGPDALAHAHLVLAPAVAVDRAGTRIGHGAGYYDRALSRISSRTEVVAVVHPDEVLDASTLPRGEHDVPIPAALTAAGLVCLVTIDGPGAPGSIQGS
ncbi:5-formyltetrahydrofolate cyclo-ligase [Brachybacterium tyrofermentans]|uniref:5-formyltetrahydrofolate cyclo-ligase n=1 Tax=Brachybacterium tyrofermentans TaxID=47848 RepID=UPI003F8D98F3